MQNSLDANSSTIFTYAVFHIKNVLTVAVFAVKTAEKDHTASPKLAKNGGKKAKNYSRVLLSLTDTTLGLNNLKGKL